MIRAALIAALVTLSAPASAAPNEQLLRSIENRLSIWNLGPVDYSKLTSSQAAALHIKLSNGPSPNSGGASFFRQELRTILNWDGRQLSHSLSQWKIEDDADN